jgi:hypothetical protein
VLNPPGLPLSGTVVIIDVSGESYNLPWIEARHCELLGETPCPCCGERGRMVRHGVYRKYHYAEQVEILRVRCRGCRVTHAVMPSFSLPDTSIGTREAEEYLKGRAWGLSRAQAGRVLSERGLSSDYPRRLERMLEVAVKRGKALWAQDGEPTLLWLAWMASLCGPSLQPLLAMNRFALERGVNALCFCRSSILLFGRVWVRGGVSHKRGTATAARRPIDST